MTRKGFNRPGEIRKLVQHLQVLKLSLVLIVFLFMMILDRWLSAGTPLTTEKKSGRK